eukprot:gene12577-6397_t
MNKNMFGYVEKNAAKYGKIFSTFIMGKPMVIVTDTFQFPYIYKNEDLFDNYPINLSVQERLMKIPQHVNTKEFMQEHTIVTLKTLQGTNLENLSVDFLFQSNKYLINNSKKEWQTQDLFKFIYDLTFESSFGAIFGDKFDIKETKKDFMYLDQNWKPFLLTSIPQWIFYSLAQARDRIIDRLFTVDPKDSHAMEDFLNFNTKYGAGLGMGILFAAMANSINATFWLVSYILNDPELKSEIEEEMKKFDSKDVLKSLRNMPLLESCVDEVFRMVSQLGSIREAMKDTKMTIDGKEYQIYKGDRILVTSINMMNEKVFENPNKFDGKRFLKNKFAVVDGKQCKNSVVSFGGGTHMCPGRFFGKNEMKLTLIGMLQKYDMKLKVDTVLQPDRTLGGMLTPEIPVYFEFKQK